MRCNYHTIVRKYCINDCRIGKKYIN
nr:hypothetical protein [Bacillus cereus]